MTEYLVESHLSGYYTDTRDPESITSSCDDCGDSDTIITSWDNEIEGDIYCSLKKYIAGGYFTDIEDFFYYISHTLYSESIDADKFSSFVKSHEENREYYKETNDYLISNLYEGDIIDSETNEKLVNDNNEAYELEMKMLKSINYSQYEAYRQNQQLNNGVSKNRSKKTH